MYPAIILKRRASMNEQKILQFLDEHTNDFYTVDSLHKNMNKRYSISRGTVARILRTLAAKNEVSRKPAFGGKIVYQRTGKNINCRIVWAHENRSLSLNDSRLDNIIKTIAQEKGGIAIEHEITIYMMPAPSSCSLER
ncbi:hypothetical protein C3408_18730 [Candidatus Pantoea alvi]|uniref:transcriptional repressor n=1 Tax=Enterobacter agglomerans TaxID=549 RepID=UPI000CDD7EC9|nr:transcriptional repressor [Pantoea agglomerans]POW55251.1 hypothetical protein C3408_18730 [Pantoea alvi]UBN52408.1 transcriptional repressor [Pantoea agglomerans]